jgi:hypothetical protein
LSSNEFSRGPMSPIRKTVTLAHLAPGQDRLKLRVRDVRATTVERERGLLIRPPAPGLSDTL